MITVAKFFLKIGSGVSELHDPKRHFLYLTLIALTTVSALNVQCGMIDLIKGLGQV